MIKIILVDDHAILRAGAKTLIERHLAGAQVAEAGSLGEALDLMAEGAGVDVAVLDLGLPDANGGTGIATLRARYPSVPVVVLSGTDAASDDLLSLGAHAFVPKNGAPLSIIGAIQAALAGEPWDPGRTPEGIGLHGLSERQRELVALCAEGLSNKAIGRLLGISDNTVRAHLALLFRRFGVKTRTELAEILSTLSPS